ncbi:MAG: hypothetical protein KDH90_26375, partial [Anaerolineae bacterium]|nr:hypothetical protein [Anaerolineae bacterium]
MTVQLCMVAVVLLLLLLPRTTPLNTAPQQVVLFLRTWTLPSLLYSAAAQINIFTRVQNVNFWRSSVYLPVGTGFL